MPHIGRQEDEQLEFKEVWTSRALEDLAAFSNHRGGTLWVGVQDDGTIVGCTPSDAEYQQIANHETIKNQGQLCVGPAGAFEQKPTLTRVTAVSKTGDSLRQFRLPFEGVGYSKPYVLARMLPLVQQLKHATFGLLVIAIDETKTFGGTFRWHALACDYLKPARFAVVSLPSMDIATI